MNRKKSAKTKPEPVNEYCRRSLKKQSSIVKKSKMKSKRDYIKSV